MTRVDFYISNKESTPFRLACRIAEKAYRNQATVYIHTHSAEQCAAMDKMLWTFREESFVPHIMLSETSAYDSDTPIHIGCDETLPDTTPDVLINLAEEVPLFFSKFARMAEIICKDNKVAGRARYTFYKDRGYPLQTHQLDK